MRLNRYGWRVVLGVAALASAAVAAALTVDVPAGAAGQSRRAELVFDSFIAHTECLEREGIFETAPEWLKAAEVAKVQIAADPTYSPYLNERDGDPCIEYRVNGL